VLALHAGRPVHKDRLVDWLWPGEGDSKVGTRNLQVAVSSLRQLLEPGVARGAAAVVVRDADTYRLQVAPGAVDLVEFDDQIALGRHAAAAGDVPAADAALARALDLYRGELLADEGAAEWVTAERDRLRLAAADAAQLRAELLLEEGRAAEAATEADRGLRIDQYRDALWRLLVAAAEAAGDRAAARRHQERYDAVLRDLGV
jgi:DNA-binding SARP family transcriptional activator